MPYFHFTRTMRQIATLVHRGQVRVAWSIATPEGPSRWTWTISTSLYTDILEIEQEHPDHVHPVTHEPIFRQVTCQADALETVIDAEMLDVPMLWEVDAAVQPEDDVFPNI